MLFHFKKYLQILYFSIADNRLCITIKRMVIAHANVVYPIQSVYVVFFTFLNHSKLQSSFLMKNINTYNIGTRVTMLKNIEN